MKYILTTLLLCFAMVVRAEDMVKVLARDKQFKIKLPANPTTGFQMTVSQFDSKLLKLISSRYQKPQTNLIGAGGLMVFTFAFLKVKKYPKTTTLLFKYARPWEPAKGSIKKVIVRIQSE